jgi:hypothetical protein
MLLQHISKMKFLSGPANKAFEKIGQPASSAIVGRAFASSRVLNAMNSEGVSAGTPGHAHHLPVGRQTEGKVRCEKFIHDGQDQATRRIIQKIKA